MRCNLITRKQRRLLAKREYIRWLIQRHVERCRSIATVLVVASGSMIRKNKEVLDDHPCPLLSSFFISFLFPRRRERQTLEATALPQDAISQRHWWAEVVDHLQRGTEKKKDRC